VSGKLRSRLLDRGLGEEQPPHLQLFAFFFAWRWGETPMLRVGASLLGFCRGSCRAQGCDGEDLSPSYLLRPSHHLIQFI